METVMSGEFGRAFFALSTAIVLTILWFGYYRDMYITWLSWGVSGILIVYITTFLTYRYFTEHIAHHMSDQPYYALFASVHGTISLGAIVLACTMFIKATSYPGNYFKMHPRLSLSLAALWPLALLSGVII